MEASGAAKSSQAIIGPKKHISNNRLVFTFSPVLAWVIDKPLDVAKDSLGFPVFAVSIAPAKLGSDSLVDMGI